MRQTDRLHLKKIDRYRERQTERRFPPNNLKKVFMAFSHCDCGLPNLPMDRIHYPSLN